MASIQGRALAELEERYEIRNGREVFRYLAEYPELEAVLIEAYAEIFKLFGDDTQVILDFWRDIEEESHISLIVYISSRLKLEEASEKLDLIDRWSAKRLPRFSGKLMFELNFV